MSYMTTTTTNIMSFVGELASPIGMKIMAMTKWEDFGHTYTKHVNVSLKHLAWTLTKKGEEETGEHLSFSSRFFGTDREIMELLRDVLLVNIPTIEAYMASGFYGKCALTMEVEDNEVVRLQGFIRNSSWELGPDNTNLVRVVIEKSQDGHDFRVTTAYPLMLNMYKRSQD